MDGNRFDALTHHLAIGPTRRTLCKALAGGTLGVVLTRVGLGRALADCKHKQRRCSDSGQCCGDLVCKQTTGGFKCGAGRRCCVKEGGKCSDSCDCCGNHICNGGYCD